MTKNDGFKFRIHVVYFFFFLFGLVLITRLFFIQVINANYYEDLANEQYIAPSAGNFDRGSIYFKEKGGQLISAATVKDGFLLAINPSILKDAEKTYQALSEIIEIDKANFIKSADKKEDPYEVISHRLDNDTAKKITNLEIKGLNVFSESWRYYPANNLASRVLGFVGYKGDTLVGRYGLEQQYESILKREEESKLINSFAEIFTDIKGIISGDAGKGDIVLTIEPTIQSILEKALKKTKEKYEAKIAGGIIIDPSTGKVLAMSVKPDFNPNFYGEYNDLSLFMNPFIESVFEMGSIMKPLTLASAIDQGKITPKTTYKDKGYVIIDKERIENFDGKARGEVSMQEILNQSLNTGAVFVMQKLGREKFREYLINYGFNERTNIDLPEEIKGLITNVIKSPREIEYATASFGQGFAVTPIEMVTALSSLANEGVMMKPYIVEEIRLKGEKDKKIEPEIKKQVLKKETSEEVTRMLVEVFDDALLGGIHKMDHYSITAKTGTAQYAQEGKVGYQQGQYVHTFFGYAPAFDAKFLTFLFLVKPQGVKYASHSLTEPFVNITKFLLNYYNIPPDR